MTMPPTLPTRLLRLAADVRLAAEQVFGDEILAGNCALVSRALIELAAEQDLKLDLVYGDVSKGRARGQAHYWAMFDDVVIDLTATQFWDVPGVYVTRRNPRYAFVVMRGQAALDLYDDVWDYLVTARVIKRYRRNQRSRQCPARPARRRTSSPASSMSSRRRSAA